MTYISEQDEQATINVLTAFGYAETDPGVYHLPFTDGLGWLVEYDYISYTFSEWHTDTQSWSRFATFHSGEALTTVLEAIGART